MRSNKKVMSLLVMAAVLSSGAAVLPQNDISLMSITAEAASSKLAAPKNIKASVPAANKITLKWDKVSGADAYRVYMYDAETKKYKKIKTVKGTTASIDGLEPWSTYYFKVAALTKTDGKYTAGTSSEKIKVTAVNSKEKLFEGVWIASDGKKITGYYNLNNDGTGSYRNADTEIGLGFNYEKSGSGYVFHMGSADDDSKVSVSVSTETGKRTLKWADGRKEYLTFAPYQDPDAGTVVSCPMFSLMLPSDVDFVTETTSKSITVYDREAKDAGYGGFAFTITAYEKPSDYYGMMDKKIGELTSGGKLYDIVIMYPSDVQYDIVKYSEMPESYSKLYKGAENIAESLRSIKGGSFAYKGGTTGEQLYGDVIKKHIKAVTEKWDSEKLEKENMSTVYYMISAFSDGDALDKVGYAYYDVNHDGIDELLIGEESDEGSIIYDVYTMVDRKPVHVVSGWDRSRWYTFENGWLCNEYSSSAFESGSAIYDLYHNTTELDVQVDFRYDYEKDEKNPWFISYSGEDGDYEAVSKEDFEQRRGNFGDYKKLNFTPLSSAE